jgi:iron complex transport system ATP-binding protein
VIAARDISFGYDGTLVLADVELSAGSGDVVGLIGPNGSGKTTLLRILYGALRPRAGLVSLDDVPVGSLGAQELARRVGVVAQEAPPELPITVAELVLLGRSPHRSAFERYTLHDRRLAAAALRRVRMRQLADRSFGALSGGEKQRVLIARTLAQEADHLLLDEPTNHLDIRHQHEVLGLVRTLDVTTVVVLHDLNLAARYCDRLILLDRGDVARIGTPSQVLTPEVLEPVYEVAVQRLFLDNTVHLIFGPMIPPTASQPSDGVAAQPTIQQNAATCA